MLPKGSKCGRVCLFFCFFLPFGYHSCYMANSNAFKKFSAVFQRGILANCRGLIMIMVIIFFQVNCGKVALSESDALGLDL